VVNLLLLTTRSIKVLPTIQRNIKIKQKFNKNIKIGKNKESVAKGNKIITQ
jgi:hypothetical protein